MSLDLTKPVQTRDGRKARIICLDRVFPDFPVVALVDLDRNGSEFTYHYRSDGRFNARSCDPLDLVNVPQRRKVEVWVNLYDCSSPGVHFSRAQADASADESHRLACVHFSAEVEDGHGLKAKE